MGPRASADGGGSVVVLCYHALSESWQAPIAVTPRALERQLSRLLATGYAPATFTQAIVAPRPGRTLVVTFDDAYRSVMEHAFPVLSRLGIPGTVFAPTSFIGSERPMSWDGISQWAAGAYGRELVPMSWPELGRLAESGWEVGSHTRTHRRLPGLNAAALREELEGSRLDCEARIGSQCTSLAYPFGRYDRTTVEAAEAAGYRVACALARYVQQPVPMAWPRVGVYRGDGDLRFRIKVSPVMRRLRTARAWQARGWLRGAVRKARRQP